MMKKLWTVLLCSLMITGCTATGPTQTRADLHYEDMDTVLDAMANSTDAYFDDITEIAMLDPDRFNAKLDRIDLGEYTVKTNYLKAGDLDRIIVTLHEFNNSKAAFEEDLGKTGAATQTHADVPYFIQEPDNGRVVTLLLEDRYISLTLDKNSPPEDIPLLIDALILKPLP